MNTSAHAISFMKLLIDHPGIVEMLQVGNERLSMPDYLSYLDILIETGHYEAYILLLAWGALFPPVNQALTAVFKHHLSVQWQESDCHDAFESMVMLIREKHQSIKKQAATFD